MTKTDPNRAAAVRAHNDRFRQTLQGGSVVMTAGIVALGDAAQARIIAAVQTFDNFDESNDPHGEHDFGALDCDGQRVFFKLDYYDLSRAMHSDDPAAPSKTERVMTIMLADEY